MRGYLGVAEMSYNDATKKKAIIKDASKLKYAKEHFSFLDDIIIWKKKPTSKTPTNKIFLVSIDEVGVEGHKYFWFSKKDHICVIECENDSERRSWVKALVFLREESMSELKPLEFEQFSCVQGKQVFHEIFECDEIDYEYDSIKIQKKAQRIAKDFSLASLNVQDKELKGQNDDEVEERSVEELSWSSEPEEDAKSEEIPEDAKMSDKAKILAQKELKKMKSAYDEFKESKKSGASLFERGKKWFGL